MRMVMDFCGFIFKRKFVIREFSARQVDGSPAQTMTVVTNDLENPDPVRYRNASYREFCHKYGIIDGVDIGMSLAELRTNLEITIRNAAVIYLRNGDQLDKLISFCSHVLLHRNRVKLLSKSGFDGTLELKVTNCIYHKKPTNYCVAENVREMAVWIRNRIAWKLEIRKNMQLILNFTGYFDSANAFRFKEFDITGINSDGIVIYRKLYVIKPTFSRKFKNAADKGRYNREFREDLGILFTVGNYEEEKLPGKLRKIIESYDINIVYVPDSHQGAEISRFFPEKSPEIVSLAKFDYSEDSDINSAGCEFHRNPRKNACAGARGRKMIFWIVNNKINLSEVRNRLANEVNIDTRHYVDDQTVRDFVSADSDELPLIEASDLDLEA